VTNNVFSQVYGGLQDETPATNQAVEDTRGEVLVDETGTPVQTFFHSSCGGRTESPEYVWREIKTAPRYLESVSDPYCKDDPFYNWELTISKETLQRRLRRAGYPGGPIKGLKIAKRSPSGRAYMIQVISAKGKTTIQGNAFRLAVGPEALRSTLITDIEQRGHSFHFNGHGWGHGVGLCQWGARGRALANQTYVQILNAYYPKVRLVKAGIPLTTPVKPKDAHDADAR
jgi:stage II sporulation protein D